jgi:Fe-S oxidoreductase
LDFGAGGMRGAADRCMNIGACRKTDSGVMCPSYMATRQEEHSTRGRANALVRALSAPNELRSLGDRRLYEILDLCLECKACSSECPLSVDMASLKSEFLHHYQAIHGIRLRSRFFAASRTLGRLGSATAPLSNAAAATRPSRWLLDHWLGITPYRPLPRFHRQTLSKWYERRKPSRSPPSGKAVVFLADSFTTYSEPHIGQAAIELLEAAGWQVHVESRSCCARASLSKGLLDNARKTAGTLVRRLHPFAERGIPIVGCEPSCIFTIRDDLPKLLPDSAAAKTVASQARSLAELVTDAIAEGKIEFKNNGSASTHVLYHPHCHERASGGSAATRNLLESVPGLTVEELDAGCCGMAGSFGFESEHYELSMQIGEDRLFPLIRKAKPEALLAATGLSCRQQILHGTGRTSAHPFEIVHDMARIT